MDLNNVIVFDIETNGMLEDLDRLHVMSIGYVSDNGKWSIESMNDEYRIKSFFENGKPYLPKNDRVYSEITKEIIGTNIGKRFAALIAPGQKLT